MHANRPSYRCWDRLPSITKPASGRIGFLLLSLKSANAGKPELIKIGFAHRPIDTEPRNEGHDSPEVSANALSLPDHLERKLDLPLRRILEGGLQHSRRAVIRGIQRSPRTVENIGIVGRHRKRKIGMVQDVEDFGSELHIERFRNPPDVIVLENREVEVHKAWSGDIVAAGSSTQVYTVDLTLRRRPSRPWGSIALCRERSRRRRNRKALCLDVIIGISRINE